MESFEAYVLRRVGLEGGQVRPCRNGYHFQLNGEVGFAEFATDLLDKLERTKHKPVIVSQVKHIDLPPAGSLSVVLQERRAKEIAEWKRKKEAKFVREEAVEIGAMKP